MTCDGLIRLESWQASCQWDSQRRAELFARRLGEHKRADAAGKGRPDRSDWAQPRHSHLILDARAEQQRRVAQVQVRVADEERATPSALASRPDLADHAVGNP